MPFTYFTRDTSECLVQARNLEFFSCQPGLHEDSYGVHRRHAALQVITPRPELPSEHEMLGGIKNSSLLSQGLISTSDMPCPTSSSSPMGSRVPSFVPLSVSDGDAGVIDLTHSEEPSAQHQTSDIDVQHTPHTRFQDTAGLRNPNREVGVVV